MRKANVERKNTANDRAFFSSWLPLSAKSRSFIKQFDQLFRKKKKTNRNERASPWVTCNCTTDAVAGFKIIVSIRSELSIFPPMVINIINNCYYHCRPLSENRRQHAVAVYILYTPSLYSKQVDQFSKSSTFGLY